MSPRRSSSRHRSRSLAGVLLSLSLLVSGCAVVDPVPPDAVTAAPLAAPLVEGPAPAAAQAVPPPAPTVAAADPKPAAPVKPPVKAPPAGKSSPVAPRAPAVAAPATAVAPSTQPATPARAQPAAAPLDLTGLENRLRETKAIGMFTKLTLKGQVDDLLQLFRELHAGRPKPSLAELRSPYDRLLLKVLALLQDEDPPLAHDIVASREPIWNILADPARFAAFEREACNAHSNDGTGPLALAVRPPPRNGSWRGGDPAREGHGLGDRAPGLAVR